jgi:oligopeptide transport system substrate-binding protein
MNRPAFAPLRRGKPGQAHSTPHLLRSAPAQIARRSGFVLGVDSLFFFVLSALLFCGCVPHERRADLVIINGAEPESLDPAIITGFPEMRIVSAMFDGLTRLNAKTAAAEPSLAERWEISPEETTYIFHIRSNAVWSTGEPITADDFVYSWIRTLDPATASDYAGQLFCLKNAEDFNAGKIKDPNLVGVHAVDAHTLRVELNHPTAFFLDVCALQLAAAVPRWTIEKYGDRWLMARPLPSSGAYELVDWRLNDKVRLKKNPRYWDAAKTQLELVDILPVGLPNTALSLYETGAADVIWDKDLLPTEQFDAIKQRPDSHTFTYLGTYFFRFNVTRKPFNDVRVRRALAMAIDRERLTRRVTKAGEVPTDHLTPDGTANYHAPHGLGYDPEEARKLLAEAGFPGGKNFPRFQYMFNAAAGGAAKIHQMIAVEMQQMWRENLGIEVDLQPVEVKVLYANQSALDYDVCRSSWVGDYNDANTFLSMFTSTDGNNRTGWKNAHYDELIQAANVQIDKKKREELFQQAEKILVADEVPIVPLYFYSGFNLFNPKKVEGIYPNILDVHPLNAIRRIDRAGAQTAAEN